MVHFFWTVLSFVDLLMFFDWLSIVSVFARNSIFDWRSVVCVFEWNPTNYVCTVLYCTVPIDIGVIHTNI